MDHQTEQIEKWKKEYFRREKWRKLQTISISFCFICIMLCVAGILYCTNQQKVQSTITVDYSRPYYTVSFDPAGGSACASKSVRLGDAYGTLPVPTRVGYTHAGWKNGSTSVVSSTQNTTAGDHTLTASWTAKTYTLTLDRQSGSGGTGSTTATYNATVPSITPPSRNGYDFAGYYSSTGGGGTRYYNASGAGVATWTTDASTTLYAYSTPKTIKITLNKNGGSGGTDTFYYKYGTNKFYSDSSCSTQMTSISKPSRTGYTFVHYYGDGSCGGDNGERYVAYDSTNFAGDLCTDIYKDATLYASWKANTYTLTIAYTVPRCGTCNAAGTLTHWEDCFTCDGSGTVTGKVSCSSCGGDGDRWSSCSSCSGSGKRTCSKCKGKGEIQDSQCGDCVGGSGICFACDGAGCSYCNNTGKCSGCGGKGWWYVDCSSCGGAGSVECSSCGGTGGESYTCGNCGGSGTVTGQVTCSSCNGSQGSNVSRTCGTCSGGKTNFSGGTQTVTVTYGQTLPSFTVKSFTGYTIGVPNYSVSGNSATSSSTYTTAGNTTWNATFTPIKYTMTLSASGGSWSGTATGTTTIAFGTSVSLTFTNSTSYDNKRTSISGYVSASGSSNASVSFVMPAQNISISGSGSGNNSCLVYDTPILTSNGWKMVQDITYTDLLVRFNHDTGQIDLAYPSWISKPVVASKVVQVTFSDGEVIRFAGDHAVFSLDQNKYVTVTDPSKFAVGTRVMKYVAGDCGDKTCSSCSCCTGGNCSTWGEAVVTDIKVLEEDVLAYSIITPGTWNCFAGNILTTVPNTIIFQNMYGFKKDLTYASSIRQKVLSGQYDDHLFTEQELKDMGWSSRDIVGFRGREWKILIESGMIDMDFVLNVLQKEVVNNFAETLLPNVNSDGNFEFVVTTSLDLAIGTFNPKNYIYEEYFEYVLPNISDENFVGWRSSSDGKIYRAGEVFIVRTGTHFQAVFLQ